MQRSVMNWDVMQREIMPSPNPKPSTRGRAIATQTSGFTPGLPPSDENAVMCKNPYHTQIRDISYNPNSNKYIL